MIKHYCSRPKKNSLFAIRTKVFLLNSIKGCLESLEVYNVIIYFLHTKDLESQITLHYNNYAKPP